MEGHQTTTTTQPTHSQGFQTAMLETTFIITTTTTTTTTTTQKAVGSSLQKHMKIGLTAPHPPLRSRRLPTLPDPPRRI